MTVRRGETTHDARKQRASTDAAGISGKADGSGPPKVISQNSCRETRLGLVEDEKQSDCTSVRDH